MSAPLRIPDPSKLARRVARTGGFTLDPRTGRFYDGAGFAVANPPGAKSVTYRTAHTFAEWIASLWRVVVSNAPILSRPGVMLGAWENDGTVYLEVSEVYPTLSDALRVGLARGEKAVYDLAAKREIPVPSTV